ncbi:hypothetical protein [Pseudoxanthomonas sp. J35]|uniref:hypothetical protein n=1 Tax=Pseudoxanthomonas sp. J35 TaxID=935852 RepID=UPI00048F9672|nr:hypothetical protein [Pseudoxanthomonas sp. J35]
MDRQAYSALLAHARRPAGNAEDARDLVQDTLLVAVENGRLGLRGDAAWLAGVLRRQAALRFRRDGRRRRREALAAETGAMAATACAPPLPGHASFLRTQSPASRQLAVLALHGLQPAEIRWVLGLDAAALRQRIARLRRALAALEPDLREEAQALAAAPPARLETHHGARLRRRLRQALGAGTLATHDPDGHLLVLRGGHARASGGN